MNQKEKLIQITSLASRYHAPSVKVMQLQYRRVICSSWNSNIDNMGIGTAQDDDDFNDN